MGYAPGATRRLGGVPLEVKQLGLGCGPLGGFRRPIAEAEVIVRTACEAGLRLFDTSPLYGYGRSELRVGHVLRRVPRDSFVLSTKVGRWLTPRRPGRSHREVRPRRPRVRADLRPQLRWRHARDRAVLLSARACHDRHPPDPRR